MRHALALLILLAAAAASAQPSVWQQPVNLYATVRSADGYVNLRSSPSSRRDNAVGRLGNGERVLVATCQRGAAGRRWCDVRRSGTDTPEARLVYDAELVYERPSLAAASSVAGAGVARGFAEAYGDGRVVSSDGYVNLRAAPSSRDGRVLRRLANDAELRVVACEARRPVGARWCLVEVQYPRSETEQVEMGYVYDAEMDFMEGN